MMSNRFDSGRGRAAGLALAALFLSAVAPVRAAPPPDDGAPGIVLLVGEPTTMVIQGLTAEDVTELHVVTADGTPVQGVKIEVLGPGTDGLKVIVDVAESVEAGPGLRLVGLSDGKQVDLERTVSIGMTAEQADAAVLAQKSRSAKATKTLQREGWKTTDQPVEPANEALLLLSPDAAKDPAGLKLALATRAFGEGDLPALERFALTSGTEIRRPALDAIAASSSPKAREALVHIYGTTKDGDVRADVLSVACPRSADDPVTALLVEEAVAGHIPKELADGVGARLGTVAISAERSKDPSGALAGIGDRLPAAVRKGFDMARAREEAQRTLAPGVTAALTTMVPWSNPATARVNAPLEADGWRAYQVGADGRATEAADDVVAQPALYRQIYVVPTGYAAADAQLYIDDTVALIEGMATVGHEVFTDHYRDRIVYVVQWLPGTPLADDRNVNFAARAYPHPVRRGQIGFTLDNSKVADQVDRFRLVVPAFAPLAVFVLYNFDNPDGGEMIPNAVLPTMLLATLARRDVRDHFGIVRMNRLGAPGSRSALVAAHELAHAALDLADEYAERGLGPMNITDLDVYAPLVLLDGSWSGFSRALHRAFFDNYQFRISECLAENAWDNVSLNSNPGRVDFGTTATYDVPGGMFFSAGTWHESAASLMATENDIGANAHPASHQSVLRQVFEGAAPDRANSRIRAAGPQPEFMFPGQNASLLLFDGDKNNRWHPTLRYEIELQYPEMTWSSCPQTWPNGTPMLDWNGNRVFMPCRIPVTRTLVRTVTDIPLRTMDLKGLTIVDAAQWAFRALDTLGVDSIDLGAGAVPTHSAADTVLDAALPSQFFPVPYQEIAVSFPYPGTRYLWRFRTDNGTRLSGWTSWQPITCAGVRLN
jgi:hypothetical protein